MKVFSFTEKACLRVFNKAEDREIENGYCGDFLSNIISRAPENCAWLTVMNNVNVAAVAVLIDCACVVLCENVEPDGALLERAKEKGITLLGSEKDVYKTSLILGELCHTEN